MFESLGSTLEKGRILGQITQGQGLSGHTSTSPMYDALPGLKLSFAPRVATFVIPFCAAGLNFAGVSSRHVQFPHKAHYLAGFSSFAMEAMARDHACPG